MDKFFGLKELELNDKMIDDIYENGTIKLELQNQLQNINSYYILRSNINTKKTAIGRLIKPNTIENVVQRKSLAFSGVTPKDSKQFAFADMLNKRIPIVTALGAAGTGKTTIAVAYALHQHFNEQKKIFLCKPTTFVGRGDNAFGPIPGDIKEKYAPYISSFMIVLKNVLGDKSEDYLNLMINKGAIEYIPVEFTRGCTFDNCVFILDEVQNLDWHELKTVVSRIGQNSQLILTGDPYQIDREFLLQETGLYTMVNSTSYLQSEITGCVYLTEQYRSCIAQLVHDIDKERKKYK